MSLAVRGFPDSVNEEPQGGKLDRSVRLAVLIYVLLALLGNAPIALVLGGDVAWKVAWGVTDSLLLLIAIFAFKPLAGHHQARFANIGFSLGVLIVYFFVSSLWSSSILYSVIASVYLLAAALAASSLAASQLPTKLFLRAALAACLSILILDYVAVEFFPSIGIDNSAFSLAGSWKGVHIQKNFAGAIYAIIVFVSFECMRRNIRRFLSFAILVLAVIFLFNSGSKTAIGLLVIVAIASDLTIYVLQARKGNRASRLSSAFIWGIVLLSMSISAAYVFITNSEPLDLTLTGRTEIWRFSYDFISQNPFFGNGYLGFWRDPSIQTKAIFSLGWRVPHAHNSFIDVMLSGGVIILFSYVVVIFSPFFYLSRVDQFKLNDSRIFIQIWLFSLLHGMVESSLLLEQEYGITALFLFSIMQIKENGTVNSVYTVSR